MRGELARRVGSSPVRPLAGKIALSGPDDLVNAGIDCLDPLDPLGGMNIADMKSRVGQQVCLKGNVNIGGALSLGTPEDVREETLACLKAGMPGGGYILSTSNSVMASVKPANYVAMLETWRAYGKYPRPASA